MIENRTTSEGPPCLREALRPAPLAVLALILVALVLNDWRRLDGSFLVADQAYIGIMALKYRQPDLFPNDLSLRVLDFYAKSYIGLLNLWISFTGGFKEALFAYNSCLFVTFAAGMYLLLFSATRSCWIAVALTFASLGFRLSLGACPWALFTIGAYLPRTQTLAMVPWLLLALSRLSGRWGMVGIFAALGIAANFHPVSSLHLSISFGFAVLLLRESRKRHLAILAVSLGAYWIAAAPYFLEAHRAKRNPIVAGARNLESPTAEQVDEVVRFRVPWTYIPSARYGLEVCFYMFLPLAAGVWGVRVRRRRWTTRDSAVLAFFGGVLICSIGGTLAVASVRGLFDLQVSNIFIRGFRMLYVPLWVFSGWLVAELWNRPDRRGRLGALIVAAALMVPMQQVEHGLRWVRWRGQIPKFHVLEFDKDFRAMCRWASEQTDRGAVFLTPPDRGWIVFRLFAERSGVVTSKEVALVIYDANVGWELYQRFQNVRAAYDDPSPPGLIEVAKRYEADYIVVADREIGEKPVFQRGPYRVYAVNDGEPPDG